MCVVAFNIDASAKYPFIFIGNRDEYHSRPSLKVHSWDTDPIMYAGQDLRDQGTWLGITENGKFSTILNNPTSFPDLVSEPKSRGQLVMNALVAKDFQSKDLERHRLEYRGYHLLFGDIQDLMYYNNIDNNFYPIPQGLHSFSNTQDDLSSYRVQRACEILQEHLTDDLDSQASLLLDQFHETNPNPSLNNLPEWMSYEEAVNRSSLFIQDPGFATVSTTLIYVDQSGWVTIIERRYDALDSIEETKLTFNLKD